ncbi:MAG: DUF6798 domain-containing protein [Nitrospiria bacterium]
MLQSSLMPSDPVKASVPALSSAVAPDRVALRDRLWLNALAVGAVIVAFKATPVPFRNELVYLVLLAKQWNPGYLANDWTLSGPWAEKLVFNTVFGPLTLVASIETVGWIGRVLIWAGAIWLLFVLGRKLDLPRWLVSAAVILWVVYGDVDRTTTGREWMLDGFEAKPVAYLLLLGALIACLQGRRFVPWMLLGLSFSMHPAVGLWGAAAVGGAWLVTRRPVPDLLRGAMVTGLFALPGLWSLLPVVANGALLGQGSASAADRAFVVLMRMSHHLDPFTFVKQDVLVLYLFLLFNVLHVRRQRPHPAFEFVLAFELCLGAIYAVGFGFRYLEHYTLLKLMPFRVFSLLIPLFFFFHLAHAYQTWRLRPLAPAAVLVGLVCLASLGSPIVQTVDQLRAHAALWTAHEADDVERAFRWVATHTPQDAIVISPPWRKDAFYLTGRAQVVSWSILRNDQLGEWRRRIEALAGPFPLTPRSHEEIEAGIRTAYAGRSESDMAALARRYGASYLVTDAPYDFPLLFSAGRTRVYALGGALRASR